MVEQQGGPPRLVAKQELKLLHVWVIPHVLSTTRSNLYEAVDKDPELLLECKRLMRLPVAAGRMNCKAIHKFCRRSPNVWSASHHMSIVHRC